MEKNLFLLLGVLRWIFGIFLAISSLFGFSYGEFSFASFVLFIGLLLIPKTGNWMIGLVTGKTELWFLPNSSQQFIQDIDLLNENDLIYKIDSKINASSKPISEEKQNLIGKRIYKKLINRSLKDLEFSENEKEKLNQIVSYFNLSNDEVSEIKRSISKKPIRQLISSSIRTKKITNQEELKIIELANFFEIPKSVIDEFKMKRSHSIVNNEIENSISDKRLSSNEEAELVQLLEDLKIPKDKFLEMLSESKLNRLSFAKKLWSLEQGIFEIVPNPPIQLLHNEVCYLTCKAKLIESKTIQNGYKFNSRGVSHSDSLYDDIRYERTNGRITPEYKRIHKKFSGVLYLTNVRIVFLSSGNKSFQIPFSQIISNKLSYDTINFILNQKRYSLRVKPKDGELFISGIKGSIKNIRNSNNPFFMDTMREIEIQDNGGLFNL